VFWKRVTWSWFCSPLSYRKETAAHGQRIVEVGIQPIPRQIGDRDHQEAMLLAESDQVWHPCHRAIVVDDLADDAGGEKPGEAGEIDGSLRLAPALEHAARSRSQRKDMSRTAEVLGTTAGIDGRPDRLRSIVG